MKMILLQDEVLEYLINSVLRRTYAAGIQLEELTIAGELFSKLSTAQTVDFSKLGDAKLEVKDKGIALNLVPECSSPLE